MPTINISGLTRDYGHSRGVFDLDITVEKGEVYGFLGPNGSGKTTALRHVMGFLEPEAGFCQVQGLDCWKEREKIQEDLGYIPGEISFLEDMAADDYLDFLLRYRRAAGERKEEMMERFELDPHQKIKKLSKGNKQKVAIVSAFMHDPDILILDEPTSGLDPLMQQRFVELIHEERRAGKTVLMSSHIFEEIEKTCQRVGIIRQGRLVAETSVEQLREDHLKSYTVQLKSLEEAASFAKDFDGVQDGREVTVQKQVSLEDVFIQYYGGGEDD